MTVEAGNDLRVADGVADVTPELARERRHPADDDRRLDPVIQRGEMARSQSAHGQTHAADALLVHLRAREQVIDGADVVPEHHPRPRETRRVDRAPDEAVRSGRRAD